jgi:outer membrane receptor protein involved in Fe transport
VGNHFLQGGVQAQRFLLNVIGGSNPTGLLTFPNLLQFAQGVPSAFTGVLPCCNNAFTSLRQFYVGTYLQDSYKVTPNLTLNFGVRWEFMSEQVERFNRFLNWYPVLGGDGACAATISCFPAFPAFPFPASFSEPGLVYPATNLFPGNNSGNWMPRLGFAWNVFGSGKTSVRGALACFTIRFRLTPVIPRHFSPP